jgi:predicted transcriptional regulator
MKIKAFSYGTAVMNFGLSKDAIHVYQSLCRHLRLHNGKYPGNEVIAKECGITALSVEQQLESLIHAGVIKEKRV